MKQNGFFDSIGGDRKYTATQISEYLKGLVSDGVLPNPSTNLQVLAMNITDSSSAEEKRSIRIRPGKAWIEGRWFMTDADEVIVLDPADVLLSRIDRIVVRLDYTNRIIDFAVIKGEASSTPVAPAITRTTEVIDLCLAEVLIRPNQTVITQSHITDTRANTSLCGWVTSLIKEIDTETLLVQYEQIWKDYYTKSTEDFNAWFADLQESLSTVVMLRRYTNVTVTTEENQTVAPIGIPQYDPAIDILEVYVNGNLQEKDINYTSDANSITFINPLPVIGTRVLAVVYKNVNGEEATTVQEEVEGLQNNMAQLMKYNYFATGTDDNIAINQIVQDFFDGTGKFAGIDANASLELKIYGKLGITSVDYNGYKAIFVADKTNGPGKRCTLDFSCASKIEHTETVALTGIAMSGITIKDLNMSIVSTASIVGANGTYVLENSIINTKGVVASYGLYGSGDLIGCLIESVAENGVSYAIEITPGLCRIERGSFGAYRKTGSTAKAAAIHQTDADSYLLCSGANLHKWVKDGYETQYALEIQAGRYSINNSIRAVANSISAEATGTINGEINISGS